MISPEYSELLQNMIAQQPDWGNSAHEQASMVLRYARQLGASTLLDYGSGTGTLKEALRGSELEIYEYDPIRGPYNKRFVDLVVCIDVMEYVEEKYVQDVFVDIARLSGKGAIFCIALKPAKARLPEGQNAHITLKPWQEWKRFLEEHFLTVKIVPNKKNWLTAVCLSKKMPSIPIGLRTWNRPGYLDVTLRSLLATELPENPEIVIMDDCSDMRDAVLQLYTSEQISLREPCIWPKHRRDWQACVGALRSVWSVRGLSGRFNVFRPVFKKGDLGGVMWCVDTLMKHYTEAQQIILVEADVVFHKDWYKAVLKTLYESSREEGPNGDRVGVVSAYNRCPGKLESVKGTMGWHWRPVHKREDGHWNCSNGIGGVMYLIKREFYEKAVDDFQKEYHISKKSGDTAIQGLCADCGFSIAATMPSFIQHIGVESSSWPERGWRYARMFQTPFVIKEEL
jgi:hypothetical protein